MVINATLVDLFKLLKQNQNKKYPVYRKFRLKIKEDKIGKHGIRGR